MKIADIRVSYVNHMGSDLSVVNAARVSFDKESHWKEYEEGDLLEKDDKLIKYLADHEHISPFHHTFITLRVKAPIFVARQLVKHEYMPWNEVSRRYVDSEPEFYFPEHWRARAEDKKQGSSDETVKALKDSNGRLFSVDGAADHVVGLTLSLYKDMLKAGVCPEQARMVLPQNLMTEWYWSGTLSAYAKMLGLRLLPDTQVETRIVAERVREVITPLFPVSLPALLPFYLRMANEG